MRDFCRELSITNATMKIRTLHLKTCWSLHLVKMNIQLWTNGCKPAVDNQEEDPGSSAPK